MSSRSPCGDGLRLKILPIPLTVLLKLSSMRPPPPPLPLAPLAPLPPLTVSITFLMPPELVAGGLFLIVGPRIFVSKLTLRPPGLRVALI